MIDIEEQLREELRAIAERAKPGSIRPLRIPPPRRRSRTVRWLAPVAAAAAVAGLIVGITVAGHSAGKRPNFQGLPAGTPKYYVTLNNVPQGGTRYVVRAVVRDSATGAPVSSVQLLRSRGFVQPLAISGAADDRAFLITIPSASVLGRAAQSRGTPLAALEILRLAPDGHVLMLSRLPKKIWALGEYGAALGGVVLSPDGTEVVMPFGPVGSCKSCAHGIAMYSVTSGVTTKWLLPRGDLGTFVPVNWPANGHEVLVSGAGPSNYRVLDVAAPGGNLLADSRSVRLPRIPRGSIEQSVLLLPTDKTLLTGYVKTGKAPPGSSTVAVDATGRVLETSTSTGGLRQALNVVSRIAYTGGLACYPESSGPSGVHVLMWCLNRFGRLDGGKFTPLPGASKSLSVFYGAAW